MSKNKGSGAGGKKFEDKTNNENNLIENGFIKEVYSKTKYGYYLYKIFENKTIYFTLQNGLKLFIKSKYNIDIFRCPDEAYIIETNDKKRTKC